MRLFPASPLAPLAALSLAAAAPAVAQAPAKPAAPAAKPIQLAPGQVAVQVQCRGMPDGTLKECKALDSKPKNPEAEQAAAHLVGQQRGTPPAGWPAAGRIIVLPVVMTPQKAGG